MLSTFLKTTVSLISKHAPNFASILRFTKDHEWIVYDDESESKEGQIGISNFAQSELGEIVHCNLPSIGKKIKKGQSLGDVESVKVVADVFSPVTGTVLKINEALKKNPGLMNKEAMKAWFVTVQIADENEIKDLMDEKQYEAFLKTAKKH